MTPAAVKGLCPRNGGCGVSVLEGLEQGQMQKVKGQDQQGTLLNLEPRISPLGQVWACGLLETPEVQNFRSAINFSSLCLDSDISVLALAN